MSRRISVNAAATFTARILASAGSLAVAVLLARRIGNEAFGTFAAVLATGAIATSAITFGIDAVVVRAVADRRPDAADTIWRAARLQVLGALAAVVGALLLTELGGVSRVLLIQALGLFPMGAVTVATAIMRGAQRMVDLLVSGLDGGLVALGITIVLVHDDRQVVAD
jgi:O-antigen/teichoic acid export membrane protein